MMRLMNTWKRAISLARATACILCMSSLNQVNASAQEHPLTAHAQSLLDTQALRNGDMQTTALRMVELLQTPGAEELAEAALLLLHDRLDRIHGRRALIEPLAALDPSRFPAAAQRALERVLAYLQRDFVHAPGTQCFPNYLADFRVLGPLAPRYEAGSARRFDELAQELASAVDFGKSYPGIDGELRWRDLRRSPSYPYVSPVDGIRQNLGLSVLAASFSVPGGGPAWIEIQATFPSGVRNSLGGFPGDLPGFGLSVNGADFEYVDCRAPNREVQRLPVVLRDGVNRVLLRSRLGGQLQARFALRVLYETGGPIGVGGWSDGPLGARVDMQPPSIDPFGDVVDRLAELRGVSAELEALLGVMRSLGGDHAGARECLANAVERMPDALYLKALLAIATDRASYLPEVWRRSRARQLAEEVALAQPSHLLMQLFLVGALTGEDREEEALALLDSLSIAHPEAWDIPWARSQVLRELGLGVLAEESMLLAADLSPDNAHVRVELAQSLGKHGRKMRSAAMHLQAARMNGNHASDLIDAANALEAAGQMSEALGLRREIETRFPRRRAQLTAALIAMGDMEEARLRTSADARRFPDSAELHALLAEIDLRAGDEGLEREHLLRGLELAPANRPFRERLMSLGVDDAATAFFEAGLIDEEEMLADYDDLGTDESTVLVIDQALNWYFDDGSSERVTQNLYHARDLDGCEALGTIGVNGDLLSLAVLKDGGRVRIEPIEVANEYVLPNLKPGDFVELIYREQHGPQRSGVHDPTSWFFASAEQPFHLSRFVLSVPEHVNLRVESARMHDLDSDLVTENGRHLYSFESRSMPRVLLEPAAPPVSWFLPMVEVGSDDELAGIADFHLGEAEWYTIVTPEIQAAADSITQGVGDEETAARRLHRFVSDHIDKRAWSPSAATSVLLGKEGNATFLFMTLLSAVGIEHELIWARASAPDEDPEAPATFLQFNRWRQRPLVLVHAKGAESAWCDMNFKLLPYGASTGIAPGAEALRASTRELVATPVVALADRPGVHLEATIRVADDMSATVDADCRFAAILGYQLKEQVRDLPENARLYNLRGIASQVLRGLELDSYELPGLESEEGPMEIHVQGKVRTFLDRDQDGFVCNLPIVPLQMGATYAGEGERRLPLFSNSPQVGSFRVTIELPASLELIDAPEAQTFECPGGTWQLELKRSSAVEAAQVWVLERRVAIGAFFLSPADYPDFVQFCTDIDNAERSRLRFRRR